MSRTRGRSRRPKRACLDHPRPFPYHDGLTGGDIGQHVASAGRPIDLDAIGLRARAQAEVKAQVALRAEAASAADLVDETARTDVDHDPGPDGAAVGPGPLQRDDQGLTVRPRAVVEERGRVV